MICGASTMYILKLKSVHADESHNNFNNFTKQTPNSVHLVSINSSYRGTT